MDTNTIQTIHPERDLMTSKLLSIAVPTYNRSDELKLLLHTLGEELAGLETIIELVISDNASTDGTDDVVRQFKKMYPAVRTIRHTTNVGMDENFCRCFEMANGHFFWMLGDDDLPKTGVIRRIIQILRDEYPDLLYLNSEWKAHLHSAADGEPIVHLSPSSLERLDFANQVNIWLTYISGMVVNLHRLRELHPDLQLRRFTGSSLVHLGWILPLLMNGNRFLFISERCVLATAGNTGGYKLFTVFGENLRAILAHACGPSSAEFRVVMKHAVWSYIPGLIWASRFGKTGAFIAENALESLAPLKSSPAYWLIILPLATLPRLLALPFLLPAKIFSLQKRVKNFVSSTLIRSTRAKSTPTPLIP